MKTIGNGIILILCFLFTSVGAQPGPGNPMMREKIRERIKTIKIWRLTEALELSSPQSEKFFVIYSGYEKDSEKLKEDKLQLLRKLDDFSTDKKKPDDELRKVMGDITGVEHAESKLKEEYFKKLSDVLTTRQIAKLMVFEEKFERELWQTMRDIRLEMGGGPMKRKQR